MPGTRVLSHPGDNPVSCELNCPILQVRRLRLREAVTCQLSKVTQPGRKMWYLCNPLPPSPPAPPSPTPRQSDFQAQTSHHGRFPQWSVIWPPSQDQGTPQRAATSLSSSGSPQVVPPSSAPPAPGRPCRDSDGFPQGSPSRLSSGVTHQHQC